MLGRPRGSRDLCSPALPTISDAEARRRARKVGHLMREARRNAQVSAEELAHRLGVSRAIVFAWESGRVSPPLARLIRAAICLGATPAALVEDL